MRRIKLFFMNAVILTVTSLFISSVSVVFSVYLSNKIGADGIGLYQLIQSIYSLAITFAASGINLAATRLVSEELARGSHQGAKRAMRSCILYSLLCGVCTAAAIFYNAPYIGTVWLQDARAIKSLYALACSLPFIAMSAALSGYFTAVRRVAKSASAQIFEQLVRMTLMVCALQLLAPSGLEYACLAVVAGGSLSELASFTYLFLLYLRDKRRYQNKDKQRHPVTRHMFGIAVPVALSSYLRMGLNTITQLMVPAGLKKSGVSGDTVLAQYGIIRGMVMPVVMFPAAFLNALAGLIVPELSESHACQDRGRINYMASHLIQVTLLFSVGVSGILLAFARPLGMALYNNRDAALFISLLAPLTIVMYFDTAVDGMLKGLDEQVSSMRYNIIDSAVSVVMLYFLLPKYGIYGYLMVIYASECLNAFLSINRLLCITDFKIRFIDWTLKPAAGILFATWLAKLVAGQTLVLPILAAVVFYILFLLVTNCITKDNLVLVRSILK